MAEQKIKWISEAYSMQPSRFCVVSKPSNSLHNSLEIKRIELVKVQIMTEHLFKIFEVYRCFDWNENVMMEYLANTMNVGYDYD